MLDRYYVLLHDWYTLQLGYLHVLYLDWASTLAHIQKPIEFIALGALLVIATRWLARLTGKLAMAVKEKLGKAIVEIVEDAFVNGLDEAVTAGRLSANDARIAYSKIAHVGFWGLHPRKYSPPPPDPEQVKENIRKRTGKKKIDDDAMLAAIEAACTN
jgi:hypothetical protein